MYNGFFKAGTYVFDVKLGNIKENCDKIKKAVREASSKEYADILVFPELCLTGYSCKDWFLRPSFIHEVEKELCNLAKTPCENDLIYVVGAPLYNDGQLYDCAVVIYNMEIKAVIPKTHIPASEKRWFSEAMSTSKTDITILEKQYSFGDIILETDYGIRLGCEFGSDLEAPLSPSSVHVLNGANVIACLAASPEYVTKRKQREKMVSVQSEKCSCAYIYASAGIGESTDTCVYSGHQLIAANGDILKSAMNDIRENGVMYACICMNKINKKQAQASRYGCFRYRHIHLTNLYRDIAFDIGFVTPYPFIPSFYVPFEEKQAFYAEAMRIQAAGLAGRLRKTGIKKTVIGISGGLDSALALLVIQKAYMMENIDMKNCICVTMPGFGTTSKTKTSAERLMEIVGADCRTVDITAACRQHFADIGHDEKCFDIVFENTQARVRTLILMDIANKEGAIVIGTGDMSELALGWATFNGDHMSMYGVNASVPKTLVAQLVLYYANTIKDSRLKEVLLDICATKISPELLPPDENGDMVQTTESSIGEYMLHDFFLYHYVWHGCSEKQTYELAKRAFSDYDKSPEEIAETFKTFITRFERNQFKRSCVPDGSAIGSISLSPHGGWEMPSDMCTGEFTHG